MRRCPGGSGASGAVFFVGGAELPDTANSVEVPYHEKSAARGCVSVEFVVPLWVAAISIRRHDGVAVNYHPDRKLGREAYKLLRVKGAVLTDVHLGPRSVLFVGPVGDGRVELIVGVCYCERAMLVAAPSRLGYADNVYLLGGAEL